MYQTSSDGASTSTVSKVPRPHGSVNARKSTHGDVLVRGSLRVQLLSQPIPPPWRAELALDRCARPTVGPRRWGAYLVCGLIGYFAGTFLTAGLAGAVGLSTTGRLIVALVPPLSLLVAIKLTQIVFGRERIVYYEKAITAVVAAAVAAHIAGTPVAITIDLVTLGVGTFLAFGRIGCFRVACCHGRRTRRGVRYRDEHAYAGFPARWVGCPIAPLQLVDGALSGALVVAGSAARSRRRRLRRRLRRRAQRARAGPRRRRASDRRRGHRGAVDRARHHHRRRRLAARGVVDRRRCDRRDPCCDAGRGPPHRRARSPVARR